MAETSKSKTISTMRCFMCRENNLERLISKSGGICSRFCVLISRFLDFDFDLANVKMKKEETLNKKHQLKSEEGDFLICCKKCVPIIESFCVDYHQLVNLRFELFSDLRRISKLLRSNEFFFQGKEKCTEKTDVFQRQLLEQCENFFSTKDFPFLKLERYHQIKHEANSDLVASTSTPISVNVVNNNDDDDYDTLPLPTETSTISVTVSNHNDHDKCELKQASSTSTAHQIQTPTFVGELSKPSRYRRILPKSPNPQDVGLSHNRILKNFKCDHSRDQFSSRHDLYSHQHRNYSCSQQTVTLQLQQPHQVQVAAENTDSEDHLINPINTELGSASSSASTTTPNSNSSATVKTLYNCSLCEKVFDSVGKLKRHEKVHFDIRPFACRFCDKKFKFTGHHRDHERIHTGIKPFQCPECKKWFKQNAHLRKHLKYHHKINPDLHLAPARRKSSNNIVGESQDQGQMGVKGSIFCASGLLPAKLMENPTYTSCADQNIDSEVTMEFEETPTTLVKIERPKYLGEAVVTDSEFILPNIE